MNIALFVGIDFTGSNGIPTDPNSLHYLNPGQPNKRNAYQEAILSAGEILLDYDSDKMVPVYGFGAKLNYPTYKTSEASHCFPCSGNKNAGGDEVYLMTGVFDIYKHALINIQLDGPTKFAPLFRRILDLTIQKELETPDHYSFFMIITDGCIHDMQDTKDVLVEASTHAISVVVVGVGKSPEFVKMRELDTGGCVSSTGVRQSRDILKFVELS